MIRHHSGAILMCEGASLQNPEIRDLCRIIVSSHPDWVAILGASALKRLEYMRSFLRFCNDSGWIDSNPAMLVKPPTVAHRPTLRFEESESGAL
jgi:site-specific recombinase XerD